MINIRKMSTGMDWNCERKKLAEMYGKTCVSLNDNRLALVFVVVMCALCCLFFSPVKCRLLYKSIDFGITRTSDRILGVLYLKYDLGKLKLQSGC